LSVLLFEQPIANITNSIKIALLNNFPEEMIFDIISSFLFLYLLNNVFRCLIAGKQGYILEISN